MRILPVADSGIVFAELTALSKAAVHNHVAHVDLLIAAGARLRNLKKGISPLAGIIHGPVSTDAAAARMLPSLLKAPNAAAHLNRAAGPNFTALALAASKGWVQTTRVLVEAKANVNFPVAPPSGRTALHLALENDHLAVAQYLVSQGACTHRYLCGKVGCTHALSTLARSFAAFVWCEEQNSVFVERCDKCALNATAEGMEAWSVESEHREKRNLCWAQRLCSNPSCKIKSWTLKKCARCLCVAYCR